MSRRDKKQGFMLIELMIVVAIVGFFAMIAVPNFMRYLARARRAEAFMNLGSIYTAEKIYWAEHGSFTPLLCGQDGAGWKPEGYTGGGKNERFYYSYGFGNGEEGKHFFTGKLGAQGQSLKLAHADTKSFLAIAAADIDGDGKMDVIGIDQDHKIIILEDDLAD
jgi:prepilin-type N-terminal cleavage/methylation domain-containing protein